jgi:hypothetical protein
VSEARHVRKTIIPNMSGSNASCGVLLLRAFAVLPPERSAVLLLKVQDSGGGIIPIRYLYHRPPPYNRKSRRALQN